MGTILPLGVHVFIVGCETCRGGSLWPPALGVARGGQRGATESTLYRVPAIP